jgi:hypothetical protein
MLQVPESAQAIYQHTDRFRQQIGSLDLMVSLYNKLQHTTLPVEWPLVASKLEPVGEHPANTSSVLFATLWQLSHVWQLVGCLRLLHIFDLTLCTCAEAALHRGLEGLVWRDDATDAYIRDTLELVRDLDSILTTIKENVAQIMELLKTFESNHMFERKVGTVPPSV